MAELTLEFYKTTCPKAEYIVKKYVKKHVQKGSTLPAGLLRMQFHDCFVRGCDASILLNHSASNTKDVEKNAPPNLTLRGFEFIDKVKNLLELECPETVSCADLLSLLTRDSVFITGGPYWNVPTGRRDGTISIFDEAIENLPSPFHNFTTIQAKFAKKGLNLKDLVILSGAHTIGISRCTSFTNRLYNFSSRSVADPDLDKNYADALRQKCTVGDNTTTVKMDPGSFRTFDKSYYTLLLKKRGLFQSDAAFTSNAAARSFITEILEQPLSEFLTKFAKSMEKLIALDVLSEEGGQIRKHCAVVTG